MNYGKVVNPWTPCLYWVVGTSLDQAGKSNAVPFNCLSWRHKYCLNPPYLPVPFSPSLHHSSFHLCAIVILKWRRSAEARTDWQNDNSTHDKLSVSVMCGFDIYIFNIKLSAARRMRRFFSTEKELSVSKVRFTVTAVAKFINWVTLVRTQRCLHQNLSVMQWWTSLPGYCHSNLSTTYPHTRKKHVYSLYVELLMKTLVC